MSDYLIGIAEKVKRAEHHIGELNMTWDEFRKRDPYSVVRKRDPKTGQYLTQFRARAPIPLVMSTIIGDLLHNLRAALDYAMCGLYVANGQGFKDVYFPICETTQKLGARLSGIEQGAGLHVMEYIKLIEPYQGGRGHPLWQLHKLDIRDKHHLLIPTFSSFEQLDVTYADLVPNDWDLPNHIRSMGFGIRPGSRCGLEDGAILFATDNAKMNPKYDIDVALDEPGVIECQPLFSAAQRLIDFVAGTLKPLYRFLSL